MASQELVESFVRFGETIPFDDDERNTNDDADETKQEFQLERPAGAGDQFGDADGNASQIDVAAAPDELVTLLERERRLETRVLDDDLDNDAEHGDSEADEERQIADNRVALRN